MLIVSGKGGVGKTVVSAALARAAVRRGLRVLLAQFESGTDAATLLGHAAVGIELSEVEPGLSVVNMTPRASLREFGMQTFRVAAVYRAVMENRMVRGFLKAIPGLDDYSMLGKAWHHAAELQGGQPRFDLVVVDGPATGQMVKTLSVPGTILDTVPDSMLTRDARTIRTFLVNPRRAAMVVVALAEELPTVEALELAGTLRGRLGMTVAGLVANAVYPVRCVCEQLEEAGDLSGASPDLALLLGEVRVFARRREINEQHLEVLRARGGAPLTTLPRLFTEAIRSADLDLLVRALEGRGE
jgi:anion-transporting  ArsA/GET3 family ATPase